MLEAIVFSGLSTALVEMYDYSVEPAAGALS